MTFVILLHRIKRAGTRTNCFPLKPAHLRSVAELNGSRILEVIKCKGIFDAVLVCRAPDSPTLARLLNALDGWHTEALLSTSHWRLDTRRHSRPPY